MFKKMVDEGLIIKQNGGRYELTNRGHETIYKILGYPEKPCPKAYLRAEAVENSLNEINSHISYLEDIKREELIQYEELIGELDKRLKKMKNSPQ
jgi:Mn-dependent DtxR family transcriptional regulator